MHSRYPRIYRMLKAHGHTATKAIEVMSDAKRRDKYAIKWIKTLRSLTR